MGSSQQEESSDDVRVMPGYFRHLTSNFTVNVKNVLLFFLASCWIMQGKFLSIFVIELFNFEFRTKNMVERMCRVFVRKDTVCKVLL